MKFLTYVYCVRALIETSALSKGRAYSNKLFIPLALTLRSSAFRSFTFERFQPSSITSGLLGPTQTHQTEKDVPNNFLHPITEATL